MSGVAPTARRIHILGASGTGTTTLGRAVAARLGLFHADADDYFWLPSDPPYIAIRPPTERLARLLRDLPSAGGWALSGSAIGWAKPLEPLYDLIVYLGLDPDIRMQRLRARERERHGARIAPGGDMAQAHAAFMTWAAAYDTAGAEQRSHSSHTAWLATQAAPVLRLDGAESTNALAAAVITALAG